MTTADSDEPAPATSEAPACSTATRENAAALLEELSDGVLQLDGQWRFTYLNATGERVIGRSRRDLLGKELWAEFPDLDRTEFGRAYRRATAEGLPVTVEAYYAPFESWFEARALPMAGGLVVLFRNVDERRRSEEERTRLIEREREARAEAEATREHFYQLLMQTPALISLMRGPRHVFELVNGPSQELLGRRDVLNKPVTEALPELQGQGFVELLDRVFQTGEPFQGNEVAARLRRDGTGEFEERYLNFVFQPYRDVEGQVQGVLSFASDVTEQVRSRHRIEALAAELARREELLRTLTNNTDSALFFMDDQQRCTFMNSRAEAMTGFSVSEVQTANKPLHDMIHHLHPDGRPYRMQDCPIDRALPQRAREKGEDVFVHKDGRFYPVAFTASPILEGGRAIGTVIEVRETTEEKRAEQERERLLERIRHSEQRYRSLVDATSQIVWTNSADGEMTDEQPGWAEFTGQTREQYRGYGWATAVHADDRELTIQRWREAVEARKTFLCEHRVRRRDGTYRRFAIRAVPVLEENGSTREWVGVHTDVTEQRAFEEQRARLVRALEESSDFIGLADLDGRTMFLNEAGRKLVGLELDQSQGRNLLDFVLPEERELVSRVVLPQVLGPAGRFQGELRFRHFGGGPPIWMWWNVFLVRDPSSQRPIGIATTSRDLTAQKRAEAEREQLLLSEMQARRLVEEQKAMLDLIIEQSGEGIIVADEAAILRVFNPAAERQHGRAAPAPPFPAGAWSEHFGLLRLDGSPLPVEEAPLAMAIRGTVSRDSRWLVRRPDGELRLLVGTASPLRRHDGTAAGGVLISRDETERQRQDEERDRLLGALEKSNAELDQFAYVASHDLKAPLRGIASLSQWIEEDLGDVLSGESRENMELLRGRVKRLEALIDGILAYSRAGRARKEPEWVDVAELLRECVELLHAPRSTRIELRGPMPKLETERIPLQQVFMNLIGNAIKHAHRPEAAVRVQVTDEEPWYHFTVADNGPGIKPEYFDRIWAIFQTLEARDDVEGTGIGLSVVKKIVETRGGRAWVESELGAGATFHVLWPKRWLEETLCETQDAQHPAD